MTPLAWTGLGIGFLLILWVASHAGYIRGHADGRAQERYDARHRWIRLEHPVVDPRQAMDEQLREIQQLPEKKR